MIEWLLGGAAAAGAAASARWTWWRPRRDGLAVLMYHKVGAPPAGSRLRSLWISPERFERQMAALQEGGWTALHFSDLDDARRAGRPLPEKSVLITFDDGYRNNYSEAFPVLSRRGLKANVFLVHDTIGRHNGWHDPESEAWLPMLRWEDIREMDRSGLVQFGSHTMTHANLLRVDADRARWELEESKKRLEDALGREMAYFAYPYGAGAEDARVRAMALEAGYRFDFSVVGEKAPWPHSGARAVPRLYIRWEDGALDFDLKLARAQSRLFGDSI